MLLLRRKEPVNIEVALCMPFVNDLELDWQ